MIKYFKSLLLVIGLVSASSAQVSLDMTLLGSRSFTMDLNDVWGWTSPSGTEYALVGARTGTSIVDISNPANPVEVEWIPGPSSTWRDIKTWGNHAYVIHDSYSGTSQGILIIDLSTIGQSGGVSYTTFFPTVLGQTYDRSHNVYMDENGVLYVFGANIGVGGAMMFDVTTTPNSPAYLGIYDTYYLHDGMARGDTLWGGAIYQGEWVAVDVSNKGSVQTLGSFPTPFTFTHNCWISDDGNTLFTTDEVSNAVLGVYDVSDMNNLSEIDIATSQNPNSGVIPHNTHVYGDFIVTSYYRDGVTIHDATYPYNTVLTAYYDCSPQFSGSGFNGAWGAYPYFGSEIIAVTDIENGLFLFSTPYTKACYLEGTVTDFSNNPIPTASVELLSSIMQESVDLSGFYATGTPNAGTYQAVYSAPGYISDTVSVTLSNGVLVVQDVQLASMQSVDLSGVVVTDVQSLPQSIPGATVQLVNGELVYNGITDASGNVLINNVFEGTYDVTVGKWGYLTECFTVTITSNNNQINVALAEGYEDDFSLDFGWTVSGNATTGAWERGIPNGTNFASILMNPDVDAFGDCGEQAFVTGNSGSAAGDDDVDGGETILTSPVFDLSNGNDWYVSFYTWFSNEGGAGSPDDSLIVSLDNGTQVVDLVVETSTTAQWTYHSFRVLDHISPTSNMQLHVRTMDLPSSGHLVEGGFDHFLAVDSAGIGLDEPNMNFAIYPNPATDYIVVSGEIQENMDIRAYDLRGVQVGAWSTDRELRIDTREWSSGTYILRGEGRRSSFTERIIIQ